MKVLIGGFIVVVVAIVLMSYFVRLPDNSKQEHSEAIDGNGTSLQKVFSRQLEAHPELSGMYLLPNGLDAFVGRAGLARLAERSIDVQYYMFHQDTVGRLLIKELLNAADRGVRVRLLVDDMYGEEADEIWQSLNAHPLFEVRLFNPFVRGYSKNLQFITDLKRVNHRMHSKTFTVDNEVTIVGGRNIGDEYFNADKELAFSDLDVMAIGPVVSEVSNEFDEYWNSENAFTVASLNPAKPALPLQQLRKNLDTFYAEKETSVYIDALENSRFAKALKEHTAAFSFAKAIVIHDASEKLHKRGEWKGALLISQLAPYIKQAREEFVLVSPYFVPGQKGADALCTLSREGVKVRVLTNSLASNDVVAVHTGYMRHRKELLRCGVELYELNEELKMREGKLFTWLPGLSKSSLHAKTMAFDHKAMFVGSFNFDQRSMNINNEIGILFYEPALAAESMKNFDQQIDEVAFRVELHRDEDGKESLRWIGKEGGKEIVYEDEPYAGFWKKLVANLLRVVPADFML